MKILVTGGTGFIGSHVVKKLVANGHEVRCLVRETSQTDALKKLGVELVHGDITDKDSLKAVAKDIDIVYHLAAIVDYRHVKSDQMYHVSLNGTENLVKACLEGNVKKFVYFSSISAIGVRDVKRPLDETVLCRPNTLYGKGKLATENMLLNYFNISGFPVNIIRPPVIYGCGDKYGGIQSLTKFINNRAMRKQPYPFFSHGKNLFSLCYAGNLVEGTILAGESSHTGEIYHLADARPYTRVEQVATIAEALNVRLHSISIPKSLIWAGSLVFEPLKMLGLNPPLYLRRYVEMTANCPLDITKAREQLGYEPPDKFKEYIAEAVDWYGANGLL